MSIEKLDAIVMRSYPLRDTSRIVHLLSAERGHIKVVAKGARGPKSRFGAALEPFTRIRAVVYYKPNRELQLLSQADIIAARRGLAGSVARFAYASAVIELLEQLLGGEEPNPPLHRLVDTILALLEKSPEENLRSSFMMFVMRLLELQGYRPELGHCVSCQGSVGERLGFDATRGGVVCGRCYDTGGTALSLSPAGRSLLAGLLEHGPPTAFAPATGDEVARVLDAFLRAHLPRYRKLRSLELVRAVGRGA
jgi:DNA repair protein RecO (recombination protein O)